VTEAPFPEDRVLVGVVNRRRDLRAALDEGWYRVPVDRFQRPFDFEVLALFLARAFGQRNGAIHFYARILGVELARRRDLLPDEPDHPRADRLYFRVALGEVYVKHPPVRNSTGRRLSFVLTTWDRFQAAECIADLYRSGPPFVDRTFYALR
jgi:hypothetical protein